MRNRAGGDGEEVKVLDIGTGSGAIACAIASALPQVTVYATDISTAAIGVARKNAMRLSVDRRCEFFAGDLIAPVHGQQYACVVANLPYVPTSELPRAPDPTAVEPRGALDGGADGLELYRRLMPQLHALLAPEALCCLKRPRL